MAIISARMQQKRGPLDKLDKDQLLPGEFAIPTDSDSIFVCLSAGNVIEIPSKQAMQTLLDTLTEVVEKGEQIVDDFEALEVEKAAINDNEVSSVTTFSSDKIKQLIDAINEFSISIVEELPTENIDDHTIYYVPKESSENDVYDEYMYINHSWEHIGSTEIDLSGYYTSEQVEEIKSELQGEIDALNSNLQTKIDESRIKVVEATAPDTTGNGYYTIPDGCTVGDTICLSGQYQNPNGSWYDFQTGTFSHIYLGRISVSNSDLVGAKYRVYLYKYRK